MNRFALFVVDDEESVRRSVSLSLKKEYRISSFSSAGEALKALGEVVPDLMLLDVGLPGMSGLEALKVIKEQHPDILVIMCTAYEDVETIVSAMRLGAYDYMVKPLQSDPLKTRIANALQTVRMRKEIQALQEEYLRENIPCFIGESDVVQDMMHLVQRVAQSPDTPILILGESGTGKELIASTIHYKSPNFKGPFVALNCAAIPRDLTESELFGYEKGAFSGAAHGGKEGLVERAAGGTLFLDEVGDLSTEAQAKLLRFLESGEYIRLGGTRKRHVKTRLVSATNRNLDELIEQGRFRGDLFYRLSVVRIEVPAVNRRREDIIPIARYFLVNLARKHGKQFEGIAKEAERLLTDHPWKGNVRELRNLVEHSVLVENGPLLTASGLRLQGVIPVSNENAAPPAEPGPFPPLPDVGIDLEALETHYISESLRKTRGNDRQAARLLGLNYYAFRYRKKQLNLRAQRTSPAT
jgi:DNA-binding NtrC family response regulator